ncbi:MAG TPA: peptidyl-alpha-hydroxyglycine alpha-amidating lyase family protein [Xanthobacteraceae bacterium]|nr:peptidyl-alpha-hydroxyglycine alpha-amidating lyase family protein [Xanthobacteraceae bacterium]
MRHLRSIQFALATAIMAAVALPPGSGRAQDPNSAPNPYRMEENWFKLPEGRKWGSTASVEVDPDGKSFWTFDRCGANDCIKSNLTPIQKFDQTGKLLVSFGANMFIRPHGIHVDRQGNVWASDQSGQDGKGHQVFKFSPEGKVLMTLGKPGVAGDGPDTFREPTDILVAPNGDFFVTMGHDEKGPGRVIKFTKDGKYIKEWGKNGSGPGEFSVPHTMAMDSTGRLFVGDRANNRIQIFDQDGKYLSELRQFGRPSGIYIDKNDMLYVADHQSGDNGTTNVPFQKGIRIGSLKDGKVLAFIPEAAPKAGMPEGIAVDDQGNIVTGWTGQMSVRRFVKK